MKNFSLKTKLIFISCISLISLAYVSMSEFIQLEEKLQFRMAEKIFSYTENINLAIGAQLYERYGDVQAFALNKVFQGNSTDEMNNILDSYMKLYGIYDGIIFVDNNGKYVASNTEGVDGKKLNKDDLENMDYSELTWFKDTIGGKSIDDKNKGMVGTVIENPHIDPISTMLYKDKKFGTSFSSLVKNSKGDIIGVITNRANFLWVENELLNLVNLMRTDGLRGFEVYIVNKDQQVIGFLKDKVSEKSNKSDLVYQRNFSQLLNQKINDQKMSSEFLNEEDSKIGNTGVKLIEEDQQKYLTAYSSFKGSKFLDQLGWGIYIKIDNETFMGSLSDQVNRFKILLSLLLILSITILLFYNIKVASFFKKNVISFSEISQKNQELENNLRQASQKLASTGQEQSAAIQETVSALSEMSSMIAQTGENIKLTQNTTLTAQEKTFEGVKVMQRLTNTMNSIKLASDQIQKIAKSIDEISSKTNIINDIVFKSQLLSFNASIEAARAGQHGRGFSVVAEEVGSLAEMSGEAALEIDNLIKDCQLTVKETIDSIQLRVKDGGDVNELAQSSFKEIAEKIKEINQQMMSINEATQQQEIGISQSNTAMKQMDVAAQQNSIAATNCFQLSEDLGEEGKKFVSEISIYKDYVLGKNNDINSAYNNSPNLNNSFKKNNESQLIHLNSSMKNNITLNAKEFVKNDEDTLESLSRDLLQKKNDLMDKEGIVKNNDFKNVEINSDDESFKKVC